MTASTVTISGANFRIYGTSQGAIDYHRASLGQFGDSWTAATATKQLQGLVAATRMLDRQRWAGTPVNTPVQDAVLEWPRAGVTDRYGTAVVSTSIPDDIVVACYELAAMIIKSPNLQDAAVSGSNVASVGAGPAQVSFFRPTLGQSGRFEKRIAELVAQYLDGAGTPSGSEAFGTTDGAPDKSEGDSADILGLSGNI